MTRRRRRTDPRPPLLPSAPTLPPAGPVVVVNDDEVAPALGDAHQAGPPMAVAIDPQCCQVERERRLEGTMVLVLTTHQVGCPAWTSR